MKKTQEAYAAGLEDGRASMAAEIERLQKQNKWLADRLAEEALKAGERAVEISQLRKSSNEQKWVDER